MDYIHIKNLKIYAYHGVLSEEKEEGQDFYVSVSLALDTHPAGSMDKLELSVNYDEVCHLIKEVMTVNKYELIESAAEEIATAILTKYDLISEVTVSLSKPQAPVKLDFEDISVNITRKWHTAYIGIGSNIGDSKKLIESAIKEFEINSLIKDVVSSTLITTKPYGYTDQPDFLNGVLCLKTLLTPHELLSLCQVIELSLGRTREIHWGPRTMDLDILFYDDYVQYNPDLIIPHPEIPKRTFVLEPLCELNPYLIHPILKVSAGELLEKLQHENKQQMFEYL